MSDGERMLGVLQQFRILFGSLRRHYELVEQQSGLGGAQLWALYQIASRPGIQVTELARCMAIHQSTASNLVNRLCRQHLAAKERRERDQRTVSLSLTDKGKEILKVAPRPAVGVLQHALRELPPERLRVLQDALAEVIKRLPRKNSAARTIPLSEM